MLITKCNTNAYVQVLPSNITANEDYNYMTAFRFQFAMKNYVASTDHFRIMIDMRAIADQWPQVSIEIKSQINNDLQYNVSVYQFYFSYAEQYTIITPS